LLALLGEILLGARVDDVAFEHEVYLLIGIEQRLPDHDFVQAGIGRPGHTVHLDSVEAGLHASLHRSLVGQHRRRKGRGEQ